MHPALKEIIDHPDVRHYDNPITDLLTTYYYEICHFPDSEQAGSMWPEVLTLPVEDRPDEIGRAIQCLLQAGCDLNDAADEWYPLMIPVGYCDAPMVRYLIHNGADCRRCEQSGEASPEEGEESNWYLDDLDIQALDRYLHWIAAEQNA